MIFNQLVSLSVNLRLACDLILPFPLSLKTTLSTPMIRAVFFVVRLKFLSQDEVRVPPTRNTTLAAISEKKSPITTVDGWCSVEFGCE
jgi:hypothetical protein